MATIKQTNTEPLPVGEYPAKIGAVELSEGQYGQQARIRFDITAPGLENRSVTGWASATFSPKSKLYGWTRAAFGRDIPIGYDLNTDHLIDRPVTLVLVTKAGDDGSEFNKIHDVKAAKRSASQPVTLTPTPAPNATLPAEDRAILKPRPAGAAGVPVAAGSDPHAEAPAWLSDNGDEELPF
jgi:hypothetical protein